MAPVERRIKQISANNKISIEQINNFIDMKKNNRVFL